MSRHSDHPLRQRAEVLIDKRAPLASRSASELLHELQVNQIELEMQNETLRQTQMAMEESRDRYVDLYDFAPVGYLSLNADGLISQINLTGAALLGAERSKLLNQRFAQFVAPQDRDRWHSHYSAAQQQGCELLLLRRDGSTFPVQLDCLYDSITRITFTDMSVRKLLENELRDSRQLLRNLAEKMEQLREEERRRIAREVHDELGQVLTALRMDVALINMRFAGHNPELQEKTQGMAELLDQAHRCVHDIVSNLRPSALDMGIIPALRWLCSEFSTHTDACCALHTTEDQIILSEVRAVAVFRIAQELLTNAARHAAASEVTISLTRHADELVVEVCDNGRGFDPAATKKNTSFGLLGIHERAIALGGQVVIYSAPNQGTAVTVIVPTENKET